MHRVAGVIVVYGQNLRLQAPICRTKWNKIMEIGDILAIYLQVTSSIDSPSSGHRAAAPEPDQLWPDSWNITQFCTLCLTWNLTKGPCLGKKHALSCIMNLFVFFSPVSDHQKLDREARICRLLKHSNIGEFFRFGGQSCWLPHPILTLLVYLRSTMIHSYNFFVILSHWLADSTIFVFQCVTLYAFFHTT